MDSLLLLRLQVLLRQLLLVEMELLLYRLLVLRVSQYLDSQALQQHQESPPTSTRS